VGETFISLFAWKTVRELKSTDVPSVPAFSVLVQAYYSFLSIYLRFGEVKGLPLAPFDVRIKFISYLSLTQQAEMVNNCHLRFPGQGQSYVSHSSQIYRGLLAKYAG